jgi:hypothetical protein
MRPHLREAMSWRISAIDIELLIAVANPTHAEVEAAGGLRGPATFALIERPNVLVLAHRFGHSPWAVQPWQATRQENADQYPPGLPAVQRPLVRVYLVDAWTGRVHAHSATSWSPRFAAGVRAALDRHLAGPQDDADAGAELEALFGRFPTTADWCATAPT